MNKVLRPQELWPDRYYHHLDAFSAGLWNINQGGGRFFKANRAWLSTQAKLDLLAEAGVVYVEAHDTDILDLGLGKNDGSYPELIPEDAKMGLLTKVAEKFKAELAQRDLRCGAFTMNLFSSEPAWNYGNLGSEMDSVRDLAIERTLKGIEIAVMLDAQVYIYWVGTNGTDGAFSAFHPVRIRRTREALVKILDCACEEHGNRVPPFAIEPKPEEPKFHMYLGSTASALLQVLRIEHTHPGLAKYLGLNIEVAHSAMCKADPAIDYAEALEAGKLFHIHENDQGGPAYDQDLASGDVSLLSLVDRMWQLKMAAYSGLLGMDVQPLPGDRNEQAAETVARTVRCLKWAVEKARSLDTTTIRELQANHDQAGVLCYVQEVVFDIQ